VREGRGGEAAAGACAVQVSLILSLSSLTLHGVQLRGGGGDVLALYVCRVG